MSNYLLHTNSSYANSDIDSSNLVNNSNKYLKYQENIRNLESLEKNFYSNIKIEGSTYSDFLSFMQALRNLLRKSEMDSEVFKKFCNTEIRKALANADVSNLNPDIQALTREDTVLVINVSSEEANQQISNIRFEDIFKGENIQVVEGEKIKINLGTNIQKIKEFLDKKEVKALLKRRGSYRKRNYDGVERFSDNIQALRDYIRQHALDKDGLFYFEYGSQFAQNNARLSIDNPFSQTINKKTEPFSEEKLQEIMNKIHDFLITTFQGTNDFNLALENTWKNNISNSIEEKIKARKQNNERLEISDYSELGLFVKGGYLSTLAGAFGEFQAALLGEYLKVKGCGNQLNPIISNTLQGKEQAKVDVSLMKDIGFQIKNYNPNANVEGSDIFDTNIHPINLFKYKNTFQGLSNDFLPFLANYFFNLSYQSKKSNDMASLISSLENLYKGELSNLSVENVEDTVSFYLINGQYLVPGSIILRNLINKTKSSAIPVEITGGRYMERAMTDFGFASEEKYTTKKGKERKGWYARRYWVKKNGSFQPTEENGNWFNILVSSQISIRSGFNYKTLFNNIDDYEAYSLY